MAGKLDNVDQKALATTTAAVAVIVSVLFLGWWAWKGTPGDRTGRSPGSDIGTSTNQETARKIAETGDNLVGQNRDDSQPGQPTGLANTTATEDPEAERELAEIRRRIEEERQQLAELARQAEYAPLGQESPCTDSCRSGHRAARRNGRKRRFP